MQLKEKIRRLRTRKSLTQKELGLRIGVSETSIKCWESGAKNPSVEKIILLSKVLCVSTDYLLGVTPESEVIDNLLLNTDEEKLINEYRQLDSCGKKVVKFVCSIELTRIMESVTNLKIATKKRKKNEPTRKIPRYYTPIAAGYSVPLDNDDYEWIETDSSTSDEADFAVEISGNSMYPYIHDGDVVFVKRTNELEIGDIGVFCVDGAMYCKQYYVDRLGNLTLVSANPELKDSNIELTFDSSSTFVCYGKVLLDSKIPLPKYFIE